MTFFQDVRFAVRLFIKDRWFTVVAVTALALGIGVNATVFTFVNAVLIRGLPFNDPDRIVSLSMQDTRGRQLGVSRLDFEDWRDGTRSFSGLVIFTGATMNVSDEGHAADQFQGTYGSANMFQLIGQKPIFGRDFRAEDDRPGAEPVVILGNGVWKNRYGSDTNLIGRPIKVNSLVTTVIGVMPPDMKFPFNNEVWMPTAQLAREIRESKRNVRSFQVFGRLASGVTLAQASSDLSTVAARLARDFPDSNKDVQPVLMKFSDRVAAGPIRVVFLSLMGAVAFVLLIACANVANLLLARSAQRSREISIRVSLGASRWRIVRQLLIESVLLALISGVLGLALSVFGIRWFDSVTQDVGKPYWMKFTMDGAVVAFFAAVCFGTGIIFGLAPALHISKTDINEVLKEGGGRSGTGGRRARRWTSTLIVVELALTLVLLAGAGFMMRSFLAHYRMDVGVDTSRLLIMRLQLPLAKYPKPETRTALYERLEERLRGINTLQASALTTNPPLQGGLLRQLSVEGRPTGTDERLPEVTLVTISAGYFDALGVALRRGRAFNAADGLPGHESAIVNQRFVAMHFPGEDPLGRRIKLIDAMPSPQPSPPVTATIVGVSPVIRQRNFQDPDPDPVVYLPYRADPQRFATLIVRAQGPPASITALVRDQMRALEPDLPLFGILTLDQQMAQQRWPFRVFGSMFAMFAFIALVLAAIGLYAITAYSVTQRTQEVGIRMALGAQARQVWWMFLKQSLVQLGIGLTIGLAGAFGVGQILKSLLVQTGTRDPMTLVSIVILLISVALAASFWPARRATMLDPCKALRYE